MIYLLTIIYILGAVFTYGFVQGTIIKTFPLTFSKYGWRNRDKFLPVFCALSWPMGLPAVAVFSYFTYGNKTKCWSIRFTE